MSVWSNTRALCTCWHFWPKGKAGFDTEVSECPFPWVGAPISAPSHSINPGELLVPAWLGLGRCCCGASLHISCSESSARCLLNRQFCSSGLLVWHLFSTLNSHNTALKMREADSQHALCLTANLTLT